MASRGWIADRIGDWVKKNPGVGAKDARAKLQDSYEDSFPLLFNWTTTRPGMV
jgi:hypothetical protein